MTSYAAPPPNYSPVCPQDLPRVLDEPISGLQIFIVPAADTLTFQKGYLGAEGERAAIEGEIHVKGAQPGQWKYVLVWLLLMYPGELILAQQHSGSSCRRVCVWPGNRAGKIRDKLSLVHRDVRLDVIFNLIRNTPDI
jgi:hypothetical protein